jgi:seryl-tRNA synthetase
MISIQYIRDNKEAVKANMNRKGRSDTALVDEVLVIDENYRKLLFEEQQVRSLRNKYSQEVNELKKQGHDISQKLADLKEIPQKVKELEEKTSTLEIERNKLLQKIPNMLHESVPSGKDDSENISVTKIGEPKNFDFEVLAHQEIATKLGCFDSDAAAQVSGTGFYYMQGGLALLNQALIRFAIETMVSHGFTYVETPLMIKGDIVRNVVDLGDQENQIYKIENEDLFLIGTSEHSLIGRYVQKTLTPSQLPVTQTSYSMCFRKEKGSHGLDERGLFRTHQFNKVEMVVICRPEDSLEWYTKLQEITIEIFTKLELPIQVLQICSGDIGDLKHVQVDIECWSPRRNKYIEVGSCSNLTDAQSLLLGIRVNGEGEKFIPHTLNNTAIATSRALVSILENNQTKDGSVKIPTILQKYMFGMTELKPRE